MRALTITGPGVHAVLERPTPVPESDELLLAPLAVGLCATDLELLDGSMVYLRDGRSRLPLVPGHEWVAEVVAQGAGVTGFEPGTIVVGECSIGCGVCATCRSGAYHQCPYRRETGVMNLDGALAGYLVLPARSLHRVPDGVSIEDAVFAEPAAVALRAVLRSSAESGSTALVSGGGTIGWLAAAMLLDGVGAEVAVAEPDPTRRERLLALGARLPEEGERFTTIIEASGSPEGTLAALDRLDSSGRLVTVSLNGGRTVPVDTDRLVVSDQAIIGSLGSPGVWPRTLELLGRGRVRPSRLVTHRVALDDVDEAVSLLRSRTAGKILVLPDAEDRDAG